MSNSIVASSQSLGWLVAGKAPSTPPVAPTSGTAQNVKLAQIPGLPQIQVPQSNDQRLKLKVGEAAKKFEASFGAEGTAEKQLANLAFLQALGAVSLNPAMVSSALEQSQAVQSNLITAATNDVAKLSATRSRVVALYNQKLVSASSLQASLATINASLNVVLAVVESGSNSIAALNVQIGKSNFTTEMSRLDKNLQALRTQIADQQRVVRLDLKVADAQVAQIKAGASNEVARAKLALKTDVESAQRTAGSVATSQNLSPGTSAKHPVSGTSLPPAIVGDDGLTTKQRVAMSEDFLPPTRISAKALKALVPASKGDQPPYAVGDVEKGTGLADYKARLQELTRQYGSIDKAAKAIGFKDGTQLNNLVSTINSGKFDPLRMNANLRWASGTQRQLLSDVGRVRSEFVQRVGAIDIKATLAMVGEEVAARTQIPQQLKDYANRSGLEVKVLVGLAVSQYVLSKPEATQDAVLDALSSPSPANAAKAVKTFVKALADTGKLTPMANTLGNIERVKRVAIQYEGLEIAQTRSDTDQIYVENAIGTYDNVRRNVSSTTAGTKSGVERIATRIKAVQDNYNTGKIAWLRSKGNETSLRVLGEQNKLAHATMQRTLINQEFSLKLQNERLKQTQASGRQSEFIHRVSTTFGDMVGWNTKYYAQAVRYGVMGMKGQPLYARTSEGLIVPPTVLKQVMNERIGTPTAAELKAASSQTIKAFTHAHRNSGEQLSKRTPAAQAAIGVFLNGDLNAFVSRLPIQQAAQTPSRVTLGPPKALVYPQAKDGPRPTGTDNPYIPGPGVSADPPAVRPQDIGVTQEQIDAVLNPDRQTRAPPLQRSEGANREAMLGKLAKLTPQALERYVLDPALRAKTWSENGILVSGSRATGFYLKALPNDTLSPGLAGSTGKASDALLRMRVKGSGEPAVPSR
jgi:archaellum component FlaC